MTPSSPGRADFLHSFIASAWPAFWQKTTSWFGRPRKMLIPSRAVPVRAEQCHAKPSLPRPAMAASARHYKTKRPRQLARGRFIFQLLARAGTKHSPLQTLACPLAPVYTGAQAVWPYRPHHDREGATDSDPALTPLPHPRRDGRTRNRRCHLTGQQGNWSYIPHSTKRPEASYSLVTARQRIGHERVISRHRKFPAVAHHSRGSRKRCQRSLARAIQKRLLELPRARQPTCRGDQEGLPLADGA
jgi:hypothetical protein